MREWKTIREFEEILFEEYNGIAKITINRPRYRNAFTPKTTWELSQAFNLCREMQVWFQQILFLIVSSKQDSMEMLLQLFLVLKL